jgi:hypothetical protein
MEHRSSSALDRVLAFPAAEDRERIAMWLVVSAAGYEFQWIAKLVIDGNFEQYFDPVQI